MTKQNTYIASAIAALLLLVGCGSGEKNPGPLQYEMRTFEERWGAVGDVVNGHVFVSITYPEILEGPSDSVREMINGEIRGFILSPVLGGEQVASLEEVAREFHRDYKERREAAPGEIFGSTLQRKVIVESDTAGILGMSFIEAVYLGGSNSIGTRRYVNIDTRSGKRLALASILEPGYEERLNGAGEAEFRRVRSLDRVESLAAAGYKFDSTGFRLNANFLIAADGLSFYFDREEVAPLSAGPIEITIPYDSIAGLIRTNGVLAHLIGKPQP